MRSVWFGYAFPKALSLISWVDPENRCRKARLVMKTTRTKLSFKNISYLSSQNGRLLIASQVPISIKKGECILIFLELNFLSSLPCLLSKCKCTHLCIHTDIQTRDSHLLFIECVGPSTLREILDVISTELKKKSWH